MVQELARDLVEILLPRGCLGCGTRIPPELPGLVCPSCMSRLRPLPAPACPRCQAPVGTGSAPGETCLECQDWPLELRTARAAVVMDRAASRLLHALKYKGWAELGGLMARRMVEAEVSAPPGSLVVPVPTTPRRRRLRGYNQARVLASEYGRLQGLPLLEPLGRNPGGSQVRLGPREREENVRGAFDLAGDIHTRMRGRQVILIDDVLTTGATACAAARVLAEGGAEVIHLRTFARALPYFSGPEG